MSRYAEMSPTIWTESPQAPSLRRKITLLIAPASALALLACGGGFALGGIYFGPDAGGMRGPLLRWLAIGVPLLLAGFVVTMILAIRHHKRIAPPVLPIEVTAESIRPIRETPDEPKPSTDERTEQLLREIDQRERIQSELKRAKLIAEKASRAKSEFLANMSHEIRTPMNGIVGTTALLASTDLTTKQKKYARTIQTCSDTLLGLISDILDLSKIEAGRMDMESIDFDLREELERVIEVSAPRAQAKGLELSLRVDSSLPEMLRGDPGRVRQVLINLVGNAIKFTEQGSVRIRVTLKATEESSFVLHFEVRDTGIGISPARRVMIFDSFSQADSSTTRRFGGSGLGLSICKKFVNMMGGEIGVDSEPGKGSRFWFTASLRQPLEQRPVKSDQVGESDGAQDMRTAGESSSESPGTDDRGLRVLLVEDSKINRELVVEILTGSGVVTDIATNGLEALEAFEEATYDLILMDCQMPKLDGFSTASEIRLRETGKSHVPIIALTANALDGDKERCIAAGMDDYLSKPVQPRQLVDRVLRWGNREQGAESESAGSRRAGAVPSPGAFDYATILLRCGGDRVIAERLVQKFGRQLHQHALSIRARHGEGDATGARALAHKLAGMASLLNATPVRLTLERLESSLTSADTAKADACLDELDGVTRQYLDDVAKIAAVEPAGVV